MSSDHHGSYYVPEYSWWPILTAVALFVVGLGSIEYFGESSLGPKLLFGGTIALMVILSLWIFSVMRESQRGLYDAQMHRTFRWGVCWVLFSDMMLFVGLAGALWYYRYFTFAELAGTSAAFEYATHYLLWPDFQANWPLLINPDPTQFVGAKQGLTLGFRNILTTLVMLASALTLACANKGLKTNRKGLLNSGLIATFILAILFLVLNITAMMAAVAHFGITLQSGIYGSVILFSTTIFLLHIVVAILLLLLITVRGFMGHFNAKNDFSVRAFSWFWNFLVLVWLVLFFSVH
jgi:cytochrome c oxidase subunit 3